MGGGGPRRVPRRFRRMKLSRTFPALLLGLLAVPRLAVREPEFDFGNVTQGTKITHAFLIENDGDAPLAIDHTENSLPGMTCRFPRSVPPRATLPITVEWDTARVQGKVRGEINVITNAPAGSDVRLFLSGTIEGPFEFDPIPEVFLSAYAGEPKAAELTLRVHDSRPVGVRLASHGPKSEVSIAAVAVGKEYRIRVGAAPGVPPGRYEESLVLATDDPGRARLELPVHLFVKADLYANPDAIDFGRVSLSELLRKPDEIPLLRQIAFVTRRGGPFRVKSASSDAAGVFIAFEPREGESATFRIDAIPRPEALRPGPLNGTITVETDDPAFPRVTIGIRGLVVE